ncbi:MAG: hypothetical protein WD036_08680 [Bauldia sp.]
MSLVGRKGARRLLGVMFVAGAGLTAGGCAFSLHDFAEPKSRSVAETAPVAAPVAPAVTQLVAAAAGDAQSDLPPPMSLAAVPEAPTPELPTGKAAGIATAAGAPSDQAGGKLLSPEEKDRVIAELEALARSQEARSAADAAKCDEEAAEVLDPQQRLARDLADREC